MESVLDVYKTPYDKRYPVVCMDESPKQLIKQTRIPIARKPGQDEKQDYEYSRQGVTNIFMANEPLKGKRYIRIKSTKTKKDWACFVRYIADQLYPKAEKIRLIMDNLNTHKPSALYETFPPEEAKRIWDRFEFIYTPKHGSWLNMAEIELNVLMGQCLNRRIDNTATIRKEVRAWEKDRNNKKAKINWQFRTDDARIKLKRLYPTISSWHDTRAKTNLAIHYNGSFLEHIEVENLKKIVNENEYSSPEQIYLQLTHQDMNLGYFKYVQNRIGKLKSGNQLLKFRTCFQCT